MPLLFIFAIICFALATPFIVWWRVSARRANRLATKAKPEDETKPGGRPDYPAQSSSSDEFSPASQRVIARNVVTVLVALGVVFTFFSSLTIVSTKNVGIVTSFGRPVDSLSNGLHFTAPWEDMTELDAAIQTDNHVKDGDMTCVTVRIARQATACVDTSIRWRIQQSASDVLFQDYREFDNIRDSLVTRELNSVLNNVFETYDPLGIDDTGNATAPSLTSLSEEATRQIQASIGDQISVLSVIIPVMHFDNDTQGRINSLQAQVAQTRIAQQAELTAEAQAQANAALAASVSNDPNVLVARCYDLLAEIIDSDQPVPVNFSCWPGTNNAVVVPSVN